MFEDWVSLTVSPVPVSPVPPVLLLSSLPHAASTSKLVAARAANLRYLRCCMWCGSPLHGVVSAPSSGGEPRNDGPEVLDALTHVAHRPFAGRWFVTGDGGVLLEDVPLV